MEYRLCAVRSGSVVVTYMNFLIRQCRVALKWRQTAVEQGSAGSVMLTENGAIHTLEAITGHQSVSTGSTAETLEAQRRKPTNVNYLNLDNKNVTQNLVSRDWMCEAESGYTLKYFILKLPFQIAVLTF